MEMPEHPRILYGEGKLIHAVGALDALQRQGHHITRNMFYEVLQACIHQKEITSGRLLYRLIMKSKLKSDSFLNCHFIRLFGACGSLNEANQTFTRQQNPSIYMWNAIISAHSNLGYDHEALDLYNQMQQQCLKADGHLYVTILKACFSLTWGGLIHAEIVENALDVNLYIGSSLIDMYSRCGSLKSAHAVFKKMPKHDLVLWSAMIENYAEHKESLEAFRLFQEMQLYGLQPNSVTLISLLKACYKIGCMRTGKLLHAFITENTFHNVMTVANNLINMYVKCGSLEDAHIVFDMLPSPNVISWNALISGYIQVNEGPAALRIFEQMLISGVQADQFTFMSILKGFCSIRSLDQAKLIHSQLIQCGSRLDALMGSILVTLYVNCQCIDSARSIFDSVPKKDIILYSAMIGSYIQYEDGAEAIQLYQQMLQKNLEPDLVTFAGIVKACSLISGIEQGMLMHALIVECMLTSDIVISNSLIDMYSRNGSLTDANCLFSSMQVRDLVTWNAIILAYAEHSDYHIAVKYLNQMQQQGFQPNDITFAIMLSVCSHLGLIKEGFYNLRAMREDHGITPQVDHYNYMVDLLGRTGHLLDAEGLLKSGRLDLNIVGWMTLLGHCRTYKDVDLARRCFDHIIATDRENSGAFTLMADIYIDAGMHEAAEILKKQRIGSKIIKIPGKAFIEINRQLHTFIVGDVSHSETDKILGKLWRLNTRLKEYGHVLSVLSEVG